MRSVLNSDLTVKIGGQFVHVINKALSVRVDGSQSDLLNTFGELPVSATLREALNIDRTHRYSTLYEVTEMGFTSVFGKNGNQTFGKGDLAIINLKHDENSCSDTKTKVFINLELYQDPGPNPPFPPQGGSLPANFTIDFGDNKPLITIHSQSMNSSGTLHVVPPFTHTYTNNGTYIMKIHAVPDWVYGGATTLYADREYEVKVGVTGCKENQREGAEEFFPVPDGSRAVSGKISVFDHSSFFASGLHTRVLAETSSWLRNGNKWKQSKSEIWGNVHTERRDKYCNVLGQVDGDGWAGSSKHIQVHRTDLKYYWYEVKTKHGIKYHDTWYVHDKFLSVCP